jgi:hypothetical protein
MAIRNGGECLSTEYKGNNSKYLWKCSAGHQWEAHAGGVMRKGSWCPRCQGRGLYEWSIEKLQKFAESKEGKCMSTEFVNTVTPYLWECKEGHQWEAQVWGIVRGRWCPKCNATGPSIAQIEIFDYVKTLTEDAILSDRDTIVNPSTNSALELDVYVPSKKLGIEFNGLLHHSDYFERNRGRHYQKLVACRNAGVRLLAIFEDEWANPSKRELIKAMIRWRLGKFQGTNLNARKLELRRLEKNKEFKDFFDRNHIDGHTNASYAWGLFHDGKLVCCASFRKNHQNEHEVARLASDYDYNVRGGASRVISQAPTPLVSFSNNRLSEGDIWSGFKNLAF